MINHCFDGRFKIGDLVVLCYPVRDTKVRTVDEILHPQYVALDGYRQIYHTDFIRLATVEEINIDYRIDHHILQFDLSSQN